MMDDPWSWDVNAQLWTLCTGLTLIVLSSIFLGKKSKDNACARTGRFSSRVEKLGRVFPLKAEKQRSEMKAHQDSPQKDKKCSCIPHNLSDITVQSSSPKPQVAFRMGFNQQEMIFDSAPGQQFAQPITDITDGNNMNSEKDFGHNLTQRNAALECDTKPMVELIAPEDNMKEPNVAEDPSEKDKTIDRRVGCPCSHLEKNPIISADKHGNKNHTGNTEQSKQPKDILPSLHHQTADVSKSPNASVSKRNETTQTCEDDVGQSWKVVSQSIGTMTDPFSADSSVSTHGKPCKLVRHYSTSTSGPFMKKLRRAHRLLVEAKKSSRFDQASSAVKWRKVLNRYKHKMQFFTTHLAKRDEMMGGTSSRITVLRGEIKDALLAVRSTKERLTTQCKLNSALMDVIESKSDNPTYGADLYPPGSGHKQEQRGPH